MYYVDMCVNVVSWVVILLVTSVSMEEVSLGCIQDGARERCFTYHDGADDMVYRSEAVDFCAAHNNASLAIVDNASVNDLLTANGPGQAWILLRLIKYGKWIHANTTEEAFERNLGKLVFHGNDCAMFSTRAGFISGKCDETHGYLCGRNKTSKGGTCPGTLVGDMCAVVGPRSAANWYTARYYCAIDHNSDLLSVDIYPEYSDMLNGSLTGRGSSVGNTYWIDVTNHLWVWKDRKNDPILGHIKYSNWKTGHPNKTYDCAVVELSTGQWESVACSGNKYHSVCEQVTFGNGTKSMESSSPTQTQSVVVSEATTSQGNVDRGQGNMLTVIIACSAVAGVLVIVIIVVIVLVISRRNITGRDTLAGDTHHESTSVPGYAEGGKGDVTGYAEGGKGDETGYLRGHKGDLYAVPLKRLRTQNPDDDDPNAGRERGSAEFEVQENALYGQ